MKKSCVVASLAAFIGLSLSGVASAQVTTWDFKDRSGSGGCPAGGSFTASFGNTINCRSVGTSTTSLQIRAYASTDTTPAGAFATAAVNDQGGSGFGAWNQIEGIGASAPQHAFDNDGSTDMMLLDFEGVSRVLNGVTVGWSGADADFQVLRWTGSISASLSTVQGTILDKTAAQMVAAGGGWELVTAVSGAANISTPDVTYAVNAGGLSSSYWLVSAYNTGFGGPSWTTGNDYIKFAGVTTIVHTPPTSVVAPGTLALAGLGLLGAGLLRRRS